MAMTVRKALLAFTAVVAALLAGCASPERAPRSFVSDRISVVTQGTGPDVVLIPGLATSREVWRGTVAAVPGYRYHLVQIEGFAGTAPHGNGAPGPLLEPLASEITRYIREQGLRQAAVVGHSLGGHLALMTAAALPADVSRTLIVDTVPFGGMLFGGPDVTVAQAAKFGADARARYFSGDMAAAMSQVYPTMIRDPAVAREYARQAAASDADVAGRLFEEVAATDLRPRLHAITAPVTVVYVGDAKTDALYRVAYQALPQAQLKRIDDSLHYVMLDQPAAFAAAFSEFLKEAR
jgi:pimeloyl-ACP methyl ester carboxylesterase